ncbi:MAG: hypothetical protein FJ255_06010 [Phycisphaerae bacterium]|nr:hypothetical protein [Phycisphaerae bacterium]
MTTTPPIGPWQIWQYLRASAAAPPPAPPAGAMRASDHVEIGAPARGLVAQRVAGQVDFKATPPTDGVSLPFYRHPADRNAAATSITAGRVLNVEA